MAKVTFFFRWYNLVVFYFFILVYKEEDEESQNRETLENLMIMRLCQKKVVPLYRNNQLTTHDGG